MPSLTYASCEYVAIHQLRVVGSGPTAYMAETSAQAQGYMHPTVMPAWLYHKLRKARQHG